MSITTALKKLAKNVFNVDPTGNNIDEIIDDIANNASGGSGGGGDSTVGNARIAAYKIHTENDVKVVDATGPEIAEVFSSGAIILGIESHPINGNSTIVYVVREVREDTNLGNAYEADFVGINSQYATLESFVVTSQEAYDDSVNGTHTRLHVASDGSPK